MSAFSEDIRGGRVYPYHNHPYLPELDRTNQQRPSNRLLTPKNRRHNVQGLKNADQTGNDRTCSTYRDGGVILWIDAKRLNAAGACE